MEIAERPAILVTPARPHRTPWVLIWASIGVVSIGVVAQGWTRWLLSDDFKSVDPGPDKFGGWRLLYLRGWQILMPALALYVIWRFLVRQAVQERRLTLDGMLIIGLFLTWFYDPATVNYLNYTFNDNSHFINRGSWANFIPGWHSPNGQHLAEPLVMMGGAYIAWNFLFVLLCCLICRRIKARYPNASNATFVAVLAATAFALDLIFEPLVFVWPGIWGYTATVPSLTLWAGSPHQFPLYEPLGVAILTAIWASARWFKDDQGHSFVERGAAELRVSSRVRTAVTLLAVIGFVNASIAAFILPYSFFSMSAEVGKSPSYIRNGACGAATAYACPSKYVPVPGKTSLHIAPDDPRLPADVRIREGFNATPGTRP